MPAPSTGRVGAVVSGRTWRRIIITKRGIYSPSERGGNSHDPRPTTILSLAVPANSLRTRRRTSQGPPKFQERNSVLKNGRRSGVTPRLRTAPVCKWNPVPFVNGRCFFKPRENIPRQVPFANGCSHMQTEDAPICKRM